MLEVRNISKSYDGIEILKDITFGVKDGSFISLLGPSGSGKSTLLYIIGGIEPPTTGQIFVDELDLYTMKDRLLSHKRRDDIGFVFQFYNLLPDLTVEENIMLPALMAGKKRKDVLRDAESLMKDTGLVEQRDKIPAKLSGGQQQRVSIARALINKPSLVLADELTGNLDSKTAIVIMELLKKLNEKYKTTIIHVTHNNELVSYGSRTIRIVDGQIKEDKILEIAI